MTTTMRTAITRLTVIVATSDCTTVTRSTTHTPIHTRDAITSTIRTSTTHIMEQATTILSTTGQACISDSRSVALTGTGHTDTIMGMMPTTLITTDRTVMVMDTVTDHVTMTTIQTDQLPYAVRMVPVDHL